MVDFARHECERELGEGDETALYRALAHDEIRIIHRKNPTDHLSFYAWDGRMFLSNAGGSHHFAAAHYISRALDYSVVIEAELHATSLNASAVELLSDEFDVFAVHDAPDSECALWDALKPSEVPYYWIPMPNRLSAARAIFLPRSNRRSRRAADVFRNAGFTDLCAVLTKVAEKQQAISDRVIELSVDAVPGCINEMLRNRLSKHLT